MIEDALHRGWTVELWFNGATCPSLFRHLAATHGLERVVLRAIEELLAPSPATAFQLELGQGTTAATPPALPAYRVEDPHQHATVRFTSATRHASAPLVLPSPPLHRPAPIASSGSTRSACRRADTADAGSGIPETSVRTSMGATTAALAALDAFRQDWLHELRTPPPLAAVASVDPATTRTTASHTQATVEVEAIVRDVGALVKQSPGQNIRLSALFAKLYTQGLYTKADIKQAERTLGGKGALVASLGHGFTTHGTLGTAAVRFEGMYSTRRDRTVSG